MSRESIIYKYVARKIGYLQTDKGYPESSGILAGLRRGIGTDPGSDPLVWGLVFSEAPDELLGRGSVPSREEEAVYIAMSLYALHQQGRDPRKESMQIEKQSIARAMKLMVDPADPDDLERVRKRFNILATSASLQEMSYYARSAITLLRGKGIGLDYARLAVDLYHFSFPEGADRVRLAWGRDFYRNYTNQAKEEKRGKMNE